MGIGRIMAKAFSYVAKSGKSTVTQNAGKVLNAGSRNTAPSILSKVETNTANRILHMQDAKAAFTPYATKVTKTNVPTQQYLDEMLGAAKVDALKAEGIYNRTAAADALAAFKHEPLTSQSGKLLKGGKLGVTSTPTQQYIDNMLGIGKVDALKAYEEGGRGTLSILKQREAAREAFTNGGKVLHHSELKPYGKVKDVTFANIPGAKKPMKFVDATFDKLISKPDPAKMVFEKSLLKNIKDAL